MKKGTEINVRFQDSLKDIVPAVYDKLMLKVVYIVKRPGAAVSRKTVVSCGKRNRLYAKHLKQIGYSWGRVNEDDRNQYCLQWEVYALEPLPKEPEPVLKELLTKFLKALIISFLQLWIRNISFICSWKIY